MNDKPIDFLCLDDCEKCSSWTKPAYYEVPSKSYYYCLLNGDKGYADTPCSSIDKAICPVYHKKGAKK